MALKRRKAKTKSPAKRAQRKKPARATKSKKQRVAKKSAVLKAKAAARKAAALAAKKAKAASRKAKIAAAKKARALAREVAAAKKARAVARKVAAAEKRAKAAARRAAAAVAKKARAAARKARAEAKRAQSAAKKAAAAAAKKAAREAERAAKALARATRIGEEISKAVGKAARKLRRKAKEAAGTAPDVFATPAPTAINAGVNIRGHLGPRYSEILTDEAQAFLAGLHRNFEPRRRELLLERVEKQRRYDDGALPDFLPDTASVRDTEWKVAPIPADLMNRRVEITGPVDRKMIVNAVNSGATHYMADFEDANSPTWANNVEGQINLYDYWRGQIAFTDPNNKKRYEVGENPAVLIVRPRGWHLNEVHVEIDGEPISASLFDFGLYFFHNALKTTGAGSGPYFYLPKLESHKEARLWNDVFLFAQKHISVWPGTIKATVLIETLPAAFEMDEILWEMRDHIAGMNAGRWDYIFSFIKTFAKNPDYILPDRSQVVMGEAFLGAYATLLVQTCHKRGAFAMGGMAAQIPIKNDQRQTTRLSPRCAPTRSARYARAMTAPGWRIPISCR